MPVYWKKRKVKIRCKKCGREFTYETGGYGDSPKSLPEWINFSRDLKKALKGKKCPYCGSADFENPSENDLV